jgi:hypothetical protein
MHSLCVHLNTNNLALVWSKSKLIMKDQTKCEFVNRQMDVILWCYGKFFFVMFLKKPGFEMFMSLENVV